MALWRITALRHGRRVASSRVGPLPTDCPYNMRLSSSTPYVSFRHLYAASMSAYVSCSLACDQLKTFLSQNIVNQ